MGLLKGIFTLVAVLVLAVVGIGAYLYFVDYEARATVTDKGEDSGGEYVVVTPKLLPFYDHKAYLDDETAPFVCVGYEVKLRVQTQVYQVFDAAGDLIYDSKTGDRNTIGALRCAGSNQADGIL